MNDIDKLIADHYRKQKFSASRRRILQTEIEQSSAIKINPGRHVAVASARHRDWPSRAKINWLTHATVGLSLVVAIVLLNVNSLNSERRETTLRSAVLYHKSKLQLDFEGSSIAELRDKMKELPFKLKLPTAVDPQELSLVGGRYCSINGQLAAHLRFVNLDSGRHYSLFQTALAPKLERLDLASQNIEGMPVRLWNEDLNFYVQAGG